MMRRSPACELAKLSDVTILHEIVVHIIDLSCDLVLGVRKYCCTPSLASHQPITSLRTGLVNRLTTLC
jgi:hypothetical protein